MGMIRIVTSGSFLRRDELFSAIEHGHARAVADAIKWLSQDLLPAAIRQDHDLHKEGDMPEKNYGKD